MLAIRCPGAIIKQIKNKGVLHMFLDLEQIRKITCGAVQVEQGADGVRFYRFNRQQMDMYATKKPVFYRKSQLTAGIRLCFRTDSMRLSLDVLLETGGTSEIFSLEVYADDHRVGEIDSCTPTGQAVEYQGVSYRVERAGGDFLLGGGDKTVTVFLPWSRITHLCSIRLDEGAYIRPVKREKTLLVFGDSITHGVQAEHPSKRYVARLADALQAEEHNKAIGGDQFCPEVVQLQDPMKPDYVLAAYGTNDWRNAKRADFERNCTAFFSMLAERYSQCPIFVITPIWRADQDAETDFDSFHDIAAYIEKEASAIPNAKVICGYDLVPHAPEFFGDARLHPNDAGFDCYFTNLYDAIKPYL